MDGDTIRAWRTGRGWSRKQLGDQLGVSDRTVEQWEQGRRQPAGELVPLALEALDWRAKFPDRTPR